MIGAFDLVVIRPLEETHKISPEKEFSLLTLQRCLKHLDKQA
jgi:hypothetical protein